MKAAAEDKVRRHTSYALASSAHMEGWRTHGDDRTDDIWEVGLEYEVVRPPEACMELCVSVLLHVLRARMIAPEGGRAGRQRACTARGGFPAAAASRRGPEAGDSHGALRT